jgi:hypothetical protein
VRIKRGIPGATISEGRNDEGKRTHLVARAEGVQCEIEVTPVLRGCVFNPELKSVAEAVEETFVWIRQSDGALVPIVVPDVCLGQNGLHEITGGEQPLAGYIACLSQASNPLVMDGICPARCDETFYGELNQQVSEMKWVKDAGIIYDDGRIRGHDLS